MLENDPVAMINPSILNFRGIIDNFSEPCVILDPDLRVHYANPAYLANIHRDLDEITGNVVFDVISTEPGYHDSVVAPFKASVQKVLETGKEDVMQPVRYDLMNGNGLEESYWQSTNMPVFNSDGTVAGIFSISKDVTTEQQMIISERQAHLNAERERNSFHDLLMHMPAMICILSGPEHIYEFVNPEYQKYFPNVKLIGTPLLEAIPMAPEQAFYQEFKRAYNTGQQVSGSEFPVAFTCNGNYLEGYFNFICQPVLGADGKVQSVLVFTYDVSEQVIARMAIEESETKLRAVLSSIPQLAWALTAGGVPLFFNQRWFDYTGLTFDESFHDGWERITHADDLPNDRELVAHAYAEGVEYIMEHRLKDAATGLYRWHLTHAIPLRNSDGDITMWVGTSTDIHEQKELEKKKDEFIGIASHELKTPLTSVKAYVQLLQRIFLPDSGQTAGIYLQKANTSLDKLSRLIEDLLDVSRIHAGEIRFNTTTFDFDELVRESIEHMQYTTAQHTITLEGETGIEFTGDRQRLEQVFTNFLSNAIKYSPSSNLIQLKVRADKDEVHVEIKDYGIGIAKDKLHRIFERFYRVEELPDTISGLGIGLYITREVIIRHNGKVWIESEPGKGTSVFFTLPL